MFHTLDTKELRAMLTGEVNVRKCPACDKEGKEYWDENGCSPLPYPHPDWGDNYDCGQCESCKGVGYIWNLKH